MKTNQMFNITRFKNYALSMTIMHARQLLIQAGVAASSIFLFVLVVLSVNDRWGVENWMIFCSFSVILAGLLYIGSAFVAFRNKEKTMSFLMIPASRFEKFVYEFTEKIVLFFLIFPGLIYTFGSTARSIAILIHSAQPRAFNIQPLSYTAFIERIPEGATWPFITIAFAISAIAFTGAATFRKLPLIKTIIFVGVVIMLSVGYFYFMIEKLNLRHPWVEAYADKISKETGLFLLSSALFVLGATALAFAFFRFKEKEVS